MGPFLDDELLLLHHQLLVNSRRETAATSAKKRRSGCHCWCREEMSSEVSEIAAISF
jgi:hypothetical protein